MKKIIYKIKRKMLNNLEKPKKIKCIRILRCVSLCLLLSRAFNSNVFYATDDPLTVINNLSDFIFGAIRAIGLIILGSSLLQIGLSFKSHDSSQRASSFLGAVGGIIITFSREILNMIIGS